MINTSWIRESFMKLSTLNIWLSLHFMIIKTYHCKIKRIKICVCLVVFVAFKKNKGEVYHWHRLFLTAQFKCWWTFVFLKISSEREQEENSYTSYRIYLRLAGWYVYIRLVGRIEMLVCRREKAQMADRARETY